MQSGIMAEEACRALFQRITAISGSNVTIVIKKGSNFLEGIRRRTIAIAIFCQDSPLRA